MKPISCPRSDPVRPLDRDLLLLLPRELCRPASGVRATRRDGRKQKNRTKVGKSFLKKSFKKKKKNCFQSKRRPRMLRTGPLKDEAAVLLSVRRGECANAFSAVDGWRNWIPAPRRFWRQCRQRSAYWREIRDGSGGRRQRAREKYQNITTQQFTPTTTNTTATR